ncbi:MAG TPA: hypothetical protein VMY43_10300 [Methanothrix sp.]|nr:hypothetical protein [Methanothrix sp.]
MALSRVKVAQGHPLSGSRACGQGGRVGAYGPGKQIKDNRNGACNSRAKARTYLTPVTSI